MVDSLPAKPIINQQGTFSLASAGENTFALFSMIVPAIAIICNGFFIINNI